MSTRCFCCEHTMQSHLDEGGLPASCWDCYHEREMTREATWGAGHTRRWLQHHIASSARSATCAVGGRGGTPVKVEAANPANQPVVDRLLAEGGYRPCSQCGAPILVPDECAACGGWDEIGDPFCSAEDYCCGC